MLKNVYWGPFSEPLINIYVYVMIQWLRVSQDTVLAPPICGFNSWHDHLHSLYCKLLCIKETDIPGVVWVLWWGEGPGRDGRSLVKGMTMTHLELYIWLALSLQLLACSVSSTSGLLCPLKFWLTLSLQCLLWLLHSSVSISLWTQLLAQAGITYPVDRHTGDYRGQPVTQGTFSQSRAVWRSMLHASQRDIELGKQMKRS